MPRLQLSSSVDVACSIADVRAFFADPHSLARWDRSVVKVVPTSEGPPRAGSTFSGALEDDMFFLKRALEHGESAKR